MTSALVSNKQNACWVQNVSVLTESNWKGTHSVELQLVLKIIKHVDSTRKVDCEILTDEGGDAYYSR